MKGMVSMNRLLSSCLIVMFLAMGLLLGCDAQKDTGESKKKGATSVVTGKSSGKPLLAQVGGQKSAVVPFVPEKWVKSIKVVVDSQGKVKKFGQGKFSANGEGGVFRDENGRPYPEKDQRVMRQAQLAIDTDDLNAVRSVVAEALKSSNVELRSGVVESLGWFGESALPELVMFLSDKDESVVGDAKDRFIEALQEIEVDQEKAGVIETVLKGLKEKELLEDVAGELVGIDEFSAIQVLVNVIEGGGPAADVAKETYNTITGDDWKSVDAAETWLQENYVPDTDS